MMRWTTIVMAFAAALLFVHAKAGAQVSEMLRFDTTARHVSSGTHIRDAGPVIDDDGVKRLESAFQTVVRARGVNMMRVHFGSFNLGRHSEIRLTSLADGAVQFFTHDMLVQWDGWSAIFNGDGVVVELDLAPGDTAWFEMTEIATNDPQLFGVPAEGGVASLCGGDNRTASNDSRVGRLSGPNCGTSGGCGGCTAWLTSVGCAATAGHCGTASGGLIEFNVPPSQSNGTAVAALPQDQYPAGATFYAFQNGGVGVDWAIMSVGPNANTGLRAHWVQGYFHLTPDVPANAATVRVTGFGVDNTPNGSQPNVCCATDSNGNCTHQGCNSSSLTLQTATGPKTDNTTDAVMYQVDTEPANSGSPVIRTSTGFALAVHTNGGCQSNGSGVNSATRLSHSTLATWLNNFLGGAVFVDFAAVNNTQNGAALGPMRTVPAGVAQAPTGGIVSIAGGNYSAAAGNTGTITKACTLQAVSGVVTIGN